MQSSWIFLALLSALSAGLVAIFGKIGISGIDTTLATTVRAIIMTVVLIIASFSLGKFNLIGSISGKPLLFIFLSGLAGAASWFFYFSALKKGPATGVAALDRLSVVFVLIFAALFLAEKMTWKSAIGATLLTVGAILMSI